MDEALAGSTLDVGHCHIGSDQPERHRPIANPDRRRLVASVEVEQLAALDADMDVFVSGEIVAGVSPHLRARSVATNVGDAILTPATAEAATSRLAMRTIQDRPTEDAAGPATRGACCVLLVLPEADVDVVRLAVVQGDTDAVVVPAGAGLPVVDVLLSGGVVAVGAAAVT